MLILSRKPGEVVVIGGDIRLTVVSIRGKQVRLGLTAPDAVPIRREDGRRPTGPSSEQGPRPAGEPAPTAGPERGASDPV